MHLQRYVRISGERQMQVLNLRSEDRQELHQLPADRRVRPEQGDPLLQRGGLGHRLVCQGSDEHPQQSSIPGCQR
jgi:hypothetical protein